MRFSIAGLVRDFDILSHQKCISNKIISWKKFSTSKIISYCIYSSSKIKNFKHIVVNGQNVQIFQIK